MGRLFGTDGVRGIANVELDGALAMALGIAGAKVLARSVNHRPRFLIGRDTRISGDLLEAALTSGLLAAGADVCSGGVLTTPAVAYLVSQHGFDAGVMISASHNPFEYNGIKFFNHQGFKLADEVEDQIESELSHRTGQALSQRLQGKDLGRRFDYPEGRGIYRDYLQKALGTDLSHFNIALDCANGSAAAVAPQLFSALGANLVLLGDQPDGLNINRDCGSTHLDKLSACVQANHLDLGLAFDGDADRLLAVDSRGCEVDGDMIMSIIAQWLRRRGRLNHSTIVATVMSNLGFQKFCDRHQLQLLRTKVGDRYVLEEMLKHNYSIGGEQSGHVIMLEYATTGDGMLTALALLNALKDLGQTLAQAHQDFTLYPQVLKKIRVSNQDKERIMASPVLAEAVAASEAVLGDSGRVLVRASGTEPVIRVMLEGQDLAQIDRLADQLLATVEKLVKP
ncbi:MAG: phosphoglucosamine mutase [Oscillospiraceae bacterium]|nr:phosphoglucosamine mutase [Oscillospiraceae bacterium]